MDAVFGWWVGRLVAGWVLVAAGQLRLVDWLVFELMGSLVRWLVYGGAGWLVRQSVGRMVGRLIGFAVSWFVGRSAVAAAALEWLAVSLLAVGPPGCQ